jgi:Glycosyl transferase family 2
LKKYTALHYKYLKKSALITIANSRQPFILSVLNPWSAYAKAAAHGALGDTPKATRYARVLCATFPFAFLKQRLAKYLGRTQPSLVRELLGPVGPHNPLRIAFELVGGAHPISLKIDCYQPSGLHVMLWHNRLALLASDRVDSINQLLHQHACPAVQWAPQKPVPLVYVAAPSAAAGALVSVLVTAYNGGVSARQALETLLAQTHANLQILVANDASTDDTWAHLSTLQGTDERLHIFNLPRNVGTYAAKSLLLQFAQGEYVVCHDSDDLADPTFVATSLAALQADAGRVAVISNWFRVDEELRIFPGAVRRFWPLLSINHSSLMLRTSVLRQMGGWDVPRVAADTELFERVRAIYGQRAVYQLPQPLTIGSLRSDSLMNDPQVGAMQTEAFRRRVEYREAWVQWHEQCKKRGIRPTMASPFESDRPFSVPDEFKVCPEDIATNFEAMKTQTSLPWSPSSGA